MIAGLTIQNWVLDWDIKVVTFLVRLLIAAACGFIIGLERKRRAKEAGPRTHTIVCMASCILMIISKYAFGDLFDGTDGVKGADPARIAAQVVSGIGFLGAGLIFYKKDFLHGLTTAAGIWATSAIGLAIGAGLIIIGVASTIMLMLVQIILHRTNVLKSSQNIILRLVVVLPDENAMEEIIKILNVKKFLKFKTYTNKDGQVQADVDVLTNIKVTERDLYKITADNKFILSIEKSDEI